MVTRRPADAESAAAFPSAAVAAAAAEAVVILTGRGSLDGLLRAGPKDRVNQCYSQGCRLDSTTPNVASGPTSQQGASQQWE